VKRSSSKANSETELTGKSISIQQRGNKVAPNSDAEDVKHTALGDFKPNDPSLTSANMLTNPDLTTDEQTAKIKDQPKNKFKSGPANN
jgi:hypothetical protein